MRFADVGRGRGRGWVYQWRYDGGQQWFAAVASGPPEVGVIDVDLGLFDTHAEAIAAVCAELAARDA